MNDLFEIVIPRYEMKLEVAQNELRLKELELDNLRKCVNEAIEYLCTQTLYRHEHWRNGWTGYAHFNLCQSEPFVKLRELS